MANRFGRFWAKGKLLIDGVRVMQQRGVFALLRRYAIPVGVIGLMLFLACLVLRSVEWRSMVFGFV